MAVCDEVFRTHYNCKHSAVHILLSIIHISQGAYTYNNHINNHILFVCQRDIAEDVANENNLFRQYN